MKSDIKIIQREENKVLLDIFPKEYPTVIKKILCRRKITCYTEVDFTYSNLLDNKSLSGINTASQLLANAIIEGKSILIVGDYDADGATATALSYLALTDMVANVQYYSTNRFDEDYGLSKKLLDKLSENFEFDVILTVDLGIASFDGVARAKELDYQVVITDHHTPSKELPIADAIVNPNLPNCKFPSKNLAGVGVVFYTLAGVRTLLDEKKWFDKEDRTKPNLAQYLDLVAMGTIADVVQLDQNNRILIAKGMELIRTGKCRMGISFILSQLKMPSSRIDCQDLSFQVIPRLNAAGRMGSMSLGVEWLISQDSSVVQSLSTELNSLNSKRKIIEKNSMHEAEKLITQSGQENENCIILHNDNWHSGIIGILAGRIKQKYHKPVFIFCNVNGYLKGSARSIQGLNIYLLLEKANKVKGLLVNFGGHALAAGTTIKENQFTQFKDTMTELIQDERKGSGILQKVIESDGVLESEYFNLQTVYDIRKIPWGESFPTPVFDGVYELLWLCRFGQHCRFTIKIDEKKRVECIAFNIKEDEKLHIGEKIHLVYEIRENYFKGLSRLQLMVKHINKIPITN